MNAFRYFAACLVVPGLAPAGVWAGDRPEGQKEDGEVPQSCTVFLVSDAETVIGGGNEDQAAFPARVWFLPAQGEQHGRLLVGFEGVAESGMNDQGLFYDSLVVRASTVGFEQDKAPYPGMWTLRALEVCSTVEDVVAFLDGVSVPGEWTDQLFFGDRNGNSIIVEGKEVLRSEKPFQICTNFSQRRVPTDSITCERYLAVERMLGEMKQVSVDAIRGVFAAVAVGASDGPGTAYTMIYEPHALRATCYLWRDFEHGVVLDLTTQMSEGARVVELADLAGPNPGRERWEAEAQRALDVSIGARLDPSVDLDVAARDLVGQYVLDSEVGLVPIPPVVLREVSVVRDRGLPRLVVAPEGIYFELRPAGKDVWFHVNASIKPEMDLVLHRNEAGEVERANLRVFGAGDVPLVKVSDTPTFASLPIAAE